ncbi:MAG: hypothetical protein RJA22_838 [Verrucomicrobiota bacterium]
MKSNSWTLVLGTLGLITLPQVVAAEEKLNPLLTAVSPTTLSGYLSSSVQWAPGTGNAYSSPRLYQADKADGFNLDVVALSLGKSLDESAWAAGYAADLWFGPDANTFNTVSTGNNSDLAIKQAYVSLRAPVGNGLDFKVGVFDYIIGYESHDAYKDPNYTRAYSVSIQPRSHTGVLMSYQFNSLFSASAGIANTYGPTINARANGPKAESFKTYMGSVALAAPDNWGWVSGSTLYAGAVNGWNGDATGGDTILNLYAGVALNTGIDGLRVGVSYDHSQNTDDAVPGGSQEEVQAQAVALYTSYQYSERLGLHLRGEYADSDSNVWGSQATGTPGGTSKLFGLTATLQYDLWKNVISRLEFIWDHQAGDNDMTGFGGQLENGATSGSLRNRYTIALNFIYKF